MLVPDVFIVWVIYGTAQCHFILTICCMNPYCHGICCKIGYAYLVKYILATCVGLLQHDCELTSQRECMLMWSSHGTCVCPWGLFTACVCADVVYSQHLCVLMWSIHSTCVLSSHRLVLQHSMCYP